MTLPFGDISYSSDVQLSANFSGSQELQAQEAAGRDARAYDDDRRHNNIMDYGVQE